MRHEAGDPSALKHSVMVGYANFMTPLAIETWCLEVCEDDGWHIDADDQVILVSFAQISDATLFRLSRYSFQIQR
jgi:hypothetical protein